MSTISWASGEPAVPDAAIEEAVQAALAHGGRPGIELSVVFVGDDTLAQMHAEHLGDPSPTDVISFDLGEEGGGPAGELYISVDRARELARARGQALQRELVLYVVHGVLHLCGHDDVDPRERARMREAEEQVMSGLGYAPDPEPHDVDPPA
jgi:probable rRNA maturation factor